MPLLRLKKPHLVTLFWLTSLQNMRSVNRPRREWIPSDKSLTQSNTLTTTAWKKRTSLLRSTERNIIIPNRKAKSYKYIRTFFCWNLSLCSLLSKQCRWVGKTIFKSGRFKLFIRSFLFCNFTHLLFLSTMDKNFFAPFPHTYITCSDAPADIKNIILNLAAFRTNFYI